MVIRKVVNVVKAVGRELANTDMNGGGLNECMGCGKSISGKKTFCSNRCANFYVETKFGQSNY